MAPTPIAVSITDFGATAGTDLVTAAIQSAIDACAAAGGGRVVVPAGRFRTGTVRLRSSVTLEVAEGGVLVGSDDIADYPVLPVPHGEFPEVRSLIWASGEHDVRLCGGGEIDFQGSSFMEMDTPDLRGPDNDKIALYDARQLSETTIVPRVRPTQPVIFDDCDRVTVEDLRFRDAPCWTICVSRCRGVRIHGIAVWNDLRIPNCDGVHLTSTRDATITASSFRCADDCVAITGVTDWDVPSENIVVSDCTMVSRSAGVRIGHLASKVRNVVVSNIVLSDGNRGVAVFAGDGGWVEDVRISQVVMRNRIFAGFWWGKGEPLVVSAAESSGRIRDIAMTHVTATSEGGIVVVGDNGNVHDITLAEWSLRLRYGSNRPLLGNWFDLQPAPSRPIPSGRIPWLHVDGAVDVVVRDINARRDAGEVEDYTIEPVLAGG